MAAAGVFGKLQLKDETDIVVLDAPASFAKETRALKGVRVHEKCGSIAAGFFLGFLTTQVELERFARSIGKHALGDAIVWMAYPKKTSRRYYSEVDRSSDLSSLGKLGYEPVRMVAIDADWTAVRFRKAGFIKRMTRSPDFALSAVGKSKTSGRRMGK